MNENYWEQAKKAHRKRLLFIVVAGIFVLIPSGIIICNNGDLLNGPDESTQESAIADSEMVVFGIDSTETEHLISNTDTLPESGGGAGVLKKNMASNPLIEKKIRSENKTLAKEHTSDKSNDHASKNDNKGSSSAQLEKRKPVTDFQKNEKVEKKLNNIDSSQQYSILLPIIQSSVIDRKDIIISLALELFYRDSTDNREILLKRDALKVVVIKLIQMKELNSIKKETLSEELKNEMNLIFERKTLFKVTIREFHIEKVAAK
jgi:flagellar basal body-associated protein FliL